MDDAQTFLTICAMAAVTYATRSGPLLFMAGRSLPQPVIRFWPMCRRRCWRPWPCRPCCARRGALDGGLGNPTLWAGLAAFALALRTRGLFGPVALGMVVVAGGAVLRRALIGRRPPVGQGVPDLFPLGVDAVEQGRGGLDIVVPGAPLQGDGQLPAGISAQGWRRSP